MSRSPDLRRARAWSAPRQDNERLIDPPLEAIASFVAERHATLERSESLIAGLPLAELRQQARCDCQHAALEYAGAVLPDLAPGELFPPDALDRPWLLSGHQPELYHPGVWFKNFVLNSLATATGGVAVNLIIDNDVLRRPSIRIPIGGPDVLRCEELRFDAPRAELPYEERRIADQHQFRSFADRAAEALAPFSIAPLIQSMWPACVTAAARGATVGEAISAGRLDLERRWGLRTVDVPLGRLCDRPAFQRFCLGIAAAGPRFHQFYNDAIRQYRREHHLRSATHPAPELALSNGWLELPFWMWTTREPTRRRLFARPEGAHLRLAAALAGDSGWLVRDVERPTAVAEQLAAARERGIKLRPRALMTTLFARLALADQFIHGIGGAKYDRVTDEIIARCWGLPAPRYVVATATHRLPIDVAPGDRDELSRCRRRLRDLDQHPERFIAPTSAAWPTAAAKRRLIASPTLVASPRERHGEFARLNAELRTGLRADRAAVQQRLVELAAAERRARLRESREFSFVLFPASFLRDRLLDI